MNWAAAVGTGHSEQWWWTRHRGEQSQRVKRTSAFSAARELSDTACRAAQSWNPLHSSPAAATQPPNCCCTMRAPPTAHRCRQCVAQLQPPWHSRCQCNCIATPVCCSHQCPCLCRCHCHCHCHKELICTSTSHYPTWFQSCSRKRGRPTTVLVPDWTYRQVAIAI